MDETLIYWQRGLAVSLQGYPLHLHLPLLFLFSLPLYPESVSHLGITLPSLLSSPSRLMTDVQNRLLLTLGSTQLQDCSSVVRREAV